MKSGKSLKTSIVDDVYISARCFADNYVFRLKAYCSVPQNYSVDIVRDIIHLHIYTENFILRTLRKHESR